MLFKESVENRGNVMRILNAYHILKNIQAVNNHIAKVVASKWTEDNKEVRFEMLIEEPGSSLTKNNYKKIKGCKSANLAYQLVCIMADLEKVGVSHMNIKPESILLNRNKRLIVTNFTRAISFFQNPERIKELIKERFYKVSGYAPTYAAQEILKNSDLSEVLIPQKHDVWSVAMTWYQWLRWENNQMEDIKRNKEEFDIKEVIKHLKKYKMNEYIPIFEQCFNTQPEERPSFEKLKKMLTRIIKEKIKSRSCSKLTEEYIKKQMGEKEYILLTLELEEAIKNDPNNKIIQRALMEACFKMGRYEKFIEYFDKYKKYLEGEEKLRMIVRVIKACITIDQEPKDMLSECSEDSKESYYYYKGLGLVYESKKDYVHALEQYNKASELENTNIRKHIIRLKLMIGKRIETTDLEEPNDNWYNLLLKSMVLYKKHLITSEMHNYEGALHELNMGCYSFVKEHGEDHPLIDNILIRLVELLGERNLYDEALEMNERIPNRTQKLLSLARLKMKELYLESAIQDAKELDIPEAYLIIAECYIKLEKYEDCITQLDANASEFLGDKDIIKTYLLSQAYIEKGDVKKGLELLNKIDTKLENEEYLSKVYSLYIRAYIKDNQYKETFQYVNKLIDIKDNAAADLALGHIYSALCISEFSYLHLNRAYFLYSNKLTDKFYNLQLKLLLATSLKSFESYEHAAKMCSKAKSILGNRKIPIRGEILNLEGACYVNSSYKKALELHNEALELYKELKNTEGEAITLVHIAEALIEKEVRKDVEKYDEILEKLGEAEHKGGTKVQARVRCIKGLISYKLNRFEEAVEHYEKAKDCLVGETRQEKAIVRFNIGTLLFLQDQFSKCISVLLEAFELAHDVTLSKKIYKLLLNAYKKAGQLNEFETKKTYLKETLEKRTKEYELLKEKLTML